MRLGARNVLVGTVALAALLAAACGSSPAQPQPQPQPLTAEQSIRQFVMPTYAHGVPYSAASNLGKQLGAVNASQVLVQLLAEPDLTSKRTNVVVTLGIIGSDTAVQRLIQLIEDGNGSLSNEEVRVRLVAVTSLGLAANVATDAVALDYLTKGAQQPEWESRVHWKLPGGAEPWQRLREKTIIGLGLSGKEEALTVLQNLQEAAGGGGGRGGGGGGGGRGGGRGGAPDDRSLIIEAIAANNKIRQTSLASYYQAIDSR